MKRSLLVAWMGLLILSACAPAVPLTGNENMPMQDAQVVTAGSQSPREILQARYARGEINRDQYQQILQDLG